MYLHLEIRVMYLHLEIRVLLSSKNQNNKKQPLHIRE